MLAIWAIMFLLEGALSLRCFFIVCVQLVMVKPSWSQFPPHLGWE